MVADHLTELGIAARADEIVTSAQAAARYLADRMPGGARVLVVGAAGLIEALRERGLVPVCTADGPVDAVVQGYSPDLDWALLAEGAVAINRGVPWVATNVDPTVPSPRGPLPGNGSLVAALRHATGREPVTTGKPDPTMHREMVLRSRAEHPIVVGDRLDTDIEGANAVGCPSLLVFSGVTTVAELLAATPKLRPTYLAADLSGLLSSHPQPESAGGVTRCGRWSTRDRGSGLVLAAGTSAGSSRQGAHDGSGVSGDGAWDDDLLDAVRALCVAHWDTTDQRDAGADQAGGSARGSTIGTAGDAVESLGAIEVGPAEGDEQAAAVLRRLGLLD